jgi:hypothetical protein
LPFPEQPVAGYCAGKHDADTASFKGKLGSSAFPTYVGPQEKGNVSRVN